MGERLVCNQEVAGSTPADSTWRRKMNFVEAAMLINDGHYVQRRNRVGIRLVIKSRAHAYAKMEFEDWMADDWEIYDRKELEPLSATWLP